MHTIPPNWRDNLAYHFSQWGTSLLSPDTLNKWAASRPEASFYDLWDDIIDPTWIPHLAYAGGTTKKQLILASCGVARLVLPLLQPEANYPKLVVEEIEAWIQDHPYPSTTVDREQVRRDTHLAPYPYATLNSLLKNAYLNKDKLITDDIYAAASVAYWAIRSGIESQLICATQRKHLIFERPPLPKGLTIWQRIAIESV